MTPDTPAADTAPTMLQKLTAAASATLGAIKLDKPKPQRLGTKSAIRKRLIEEGHLPRTYFTRRRTRSRDRAFGEALRCLHIDDRALAIRLWG